MYNLLLIMMNGKGASARAVWLWFCLLAALPAAGQEVRLHERPSGVEVTFAWAQAPSSPAEALRALKAKGFEPALPPGNPEVPSRTLRIAIPPEGEASWSVEGLDEIPLNAPLSIRSDVDRDWDPRPAEVLPSDAVEFVGEGWFRQVRFLTFRIHPLRPSEIGAVLTRGLTLSVSFPSSAGAPVQDHPAFDSAYARLFVNDWRDKGAAHSATPRESGKAGRQEGNNEKRRTPNEEQLLTNDQGPGTKDALNYELRAASYDLPAVSSYRPTLAPGSSAYKIKVRAAGLYKLDYNFFLTRSIPVNDIAKLHVQNLGADVAVRVEENAPANNILEPGEAVYFYGIPYKGEEGDWNQPSDLWQHGDYTDENIYWVFCGTTPGLRMGMRAVTPKWAADAAQFIATQTFEQDSLYRPFVPVRNDDLWLWKDAYRYKGSPDDIVIADHLVTIPSVDGSIGTVAFSLTVRGRTSDASVSPDHQVQVSVNGTSVGSFSFDGNVPHTASLSFLQSRLLSGTQVNTVRVEVLDPALMGLNADAIQTNRFTLTYSRKLEAYQNQLAFPVGIDSVDYPVRAFTSSEVKGVDVTNPAAPVWLSGIQVAADGSNYKATLSRGTASGIPTYFLSVPSVPAPADIALDAPSDLLASAAGMNWILVTTSSWTGHSQVAALAAQRSAQGYAPLVAPITDIYDEFSFGLMSPLALRAFFDAAYHLSSPSSIVGAVLLGDGTLDYKNNAGYGAQNLVPAFMVHDETGGTSLAPIAQYGWDNNYACVAGSDLIPDFYLGRVPAQTSDEVTNALSKSINFSTPADPAYQKGNVFAAGCRDGDQWNAYQDQNAAIVTPAPPHTVSKMYYRGAPWDCVKTDSDSDGIFDYNEALTDAFNAGQGIVSYIGHGSFQFWDDHSILALNDVPLMTNAEMPAVVLNADCYTSAFFFSFSNPAILEAMLTATGGTAASGGPGGFMYNFQSDEITRPFYEAFFGLEKERRLGPLFHGIVTELESSGDERATKGYVVLGDPLAVFALPTPGAPSDLQASVDCRDVTLTWSPPAGGFTGTYRVYRAAAASGPWAVIEEKALTATYADASGTVGQTYYYRVTALDAAGYEGKGSGVASATPAACAPDPPTGLSCADPGIGGRLEVTWTPASQTEIFGYRVYYGSAPGTYTDSMEIPCTCGYAMLSGLSDGMATHLTVTAIAYGGLESDPAPEVACVPSAFRRWSPPRMAYPLMMSRDPSDRPVLAWELPVLDIWSQPTTVARCSVYRTVLPDAVPDRSIGSADRLAWVESAACAGGHCTWTDPSPPLNGFYEVTCQTALGEESSIGGPPPTAPAGQFRRPETGELWWDIVILTTEGGEADVLSYRIYKSYDPTFRPDVQGGSNLSAEVWEPYYQDAPGGYTLIMAVDGRGNVGPY